MRITFVLPSLELSGGNLVVAIYASALAVKGHQVTVVALRYSRPTYLETLRSIARSGRMFQEPEMVIERFRNVDVRQATAAEIVAGAVLPEADILVATWWETVELIGSVSSDKGTKIHFVQGLEIFEYLPQDRTRAVLRREIPKIVVSRWLAEELRNTFGAKEVHLIENAVDLDRFESPVRNKNLLPTFGFLHSSTPCKNVELAIESLTLVKRQISSVNVIAFGYRSAEVPAWIEYHRAPAQELIPRLYARCDAWLWTSSSEGFGLPILEAMASHTPVIATRAGAAPELVNDRNGQLVDSSLDSVVPAILRIANMTNAEWLLLSDNAYQQARRNTWPKAIEKMEIILRAYIS